MNAEKEPPADIFELVLWLPLSKPCGFGTGSRVQSSAENQALMTSQRRGFWHSPKIIFKIEANPYNRHLATVEEPCRRGLGFLAAICRVDNRPTVQVHNYGGPEVLRFEDAPRPTPASGELLIKVHAASVNAIDCAGAQAKELWIVCAGVGWLAGGAGCATCLPWPAIARKEGRPDAQKRRPRVALC
jgi:hypothetical protein